MRLNMAFRPIVTRRYAHLIQRTRQGGIVSINTTTGEYTEEKVKMFNIYDTFLPPLESRHAAFIPFSIFSFLGSTFSSIGGVLSMQSLLIAASNISPSIGTGIGLAATINWILKDGLGQLGGVLFAAKFGQRLDLDPRFFRYYSMVSLQLGSFLEILTALLPPALFLPVAGIANVAKNISWMGMSATRTKIMEGFQMNNNIAEITAKHWSQVVTASVVGMAGGIGVSWIGSALGLPPTLFNLFAFPVFAALSIFFTYDSCRCLNANILTVNRLKTITADLLSKHLEHFNSRSVVKCVSAIKTPRELTLRENFLVPFDDPFPNVLINPPLTRALLKTLQKSSTLTTRLAKKLKIYFACHEGNYCLWVAHDFDTPFCAVPIIMLACYCSAVFRGLSEGASLTDEERDKQMFLLFDKTYDTYSDAVFEIACGMEKDRHWRLRDDFIPLLHSLMVKPE